MANVAENLSRLPMGRRRGSTRYFCGDWAHTGEMLSAKVEEEDQDWGKGGRPWLPVLFLSCLVLEAVL